MNVLEVYAKAVNETVSLFERKAEFTDEDFAVQLELLKDPIYCPICGSCGETGCCESGMCKGVQGLYCDSNIKAYEEILADCEQFYTTLVAISKTGGYAAELAKEALEV